MEVLKHKYDLSHSQREQYNFRDLMSSFPRADLNIEEEAAINEHFKSLGHRAISEQDLEKLHELVSAHSPTKDRFIEKLYEKYRINKLTHRLCIRDGEIEKRLP